MQLFFQRVCARLCNLHNINNRIIHPETIGAAASDRPSMI